MERNEVADRLDEEAATSTPTGPGPFIAVDLNIIWEELRKGVRIMREQNW